MTERRKPKLLIIGYARHGKDTVASLISDMMGLQFTSSSEFVGRECIWPMWGMERYGTFEEMFEDRVNFRQTWFSLIAAYNTPNNARTAETMLERGNHMYVGMRRYAEWEACVKKKIFDHIIWVDASGRLPKEDTSSMELEPKHGDLYIDNNGPEEKLFETIVGLQKMLHEEGFDVNYLEPLVMPAASEEKEEAPTLDERKAWEAMPEGAIQVLDHGFFIVREVMGNDEAIAEAARMSYGRGTKKKNTTQGLINYLVRNRHTSPLEMGEIKVHMRLPIFVMRQWVRHRTANLNEYSGRYSEMVRLFYVPDLEQIRDQHAVNKQGSGEPLSGAEGEMARGLIYNAADQAFDDYEHLLKMGVSRETARMVLPLNTYTEVVWKIDVSNLIKFLFLRDDEHAQWEIRVYAKLMAEALERFFPLVYAAYERERQAVSLTQEQIAALITGRYEGLGKGDTHLVQHFRSLQGFT